MKYSSTNVKSAKLVFVVDDDQDLQHLVCRWLELGGFQPVSISSGEECLKNLNVIMPDCILLDLNLPTLSGIETLKKIKTNYNRLPIIMMTANIDLSNVVTAIKLGAFDYLSKPLERERLLAFVKNAIEKTEEVNVPSEVNTKNIGIAYERIIGNSKPIRNLFKQLDSIAFSDITVLIQGASGTGKELVAQAIHANSSRKHSPFVALNCAAIPESLQESELFGYEKGAFTGATSKKIGKIEQANNGTLFLDEVGEMSLSLQVKLLRVLQERSFQRVGGSNDIHVDFRLISASHVNLSEAVKNNKFREDLFYRLAVFELEIPTLADRKDDIPLISKKLIQDFSKEMDKHFTITDEALECLQNYNFPGNVRELQNALQRACVICQNNIIQVNDLPARILNKTGSERNNTTEFLTKNKLSQSMESTEKKAIEEAIKRADGNLSEAIRQLGIGRATFYRKLKKFGLK